MIELKNVSFSYFDEPVLKNLSLRFRGSENQRLIDVPASLKAGEVILWEDWQGEKKGMKT